MSRPWMPLWVADYLADTAHLSVAEHGAYLLLIMHYWMRGSLPANDAQLARIARMTEAEWMAARPTLRPLFEDDNWRHKRVEEELADTAERYEKRSAAGRKGGQVRAARRAASSNAQAMNNQPQSQPQKKDAEDARAPLEFSESVSRETANTAFDLAEKIGVAMGYPTAHDWPPNFCGAPYVIEKWLREGFRADVILTTVKAVLAKKKGGPPDSVNYFEKPVADAMARLNAPVAQGKVTNENTKPSSKSSPGGGFATVAAKLRVISAG